MRVQCVAGLGHRVGPGDLGENITTRGLALLDLAVGTRLSFGEAVVTVTGLRNPCVQIDRFQPGLLARVVRRSAYGGIERLAGVMGIVSRGGTVAPGQEILVESPSGLPRRLSTV